MMCKLCVDDGKLFEIGNMHVGILRLENWLVSLLVSTCFTSLHDQIICSANHFYMRALGHKIDIYGPGYNNNKNTLTELVIFNFYD